MSILATAWENIYGLLVDDGWIAIGTLLALVATGLWTSLTIGNQTLADLGGPLLFALLMVLLLVNVHAAGRNAARTRL